MSTALVYFEHRFVSRTMDVNQKQRSVYYKPAKDLLNISLPPFNEGQLQVSFFFSALYVCGGVIFTDVIYIIHAICYITVVRATLFDWATVMGICTWRTLVVCISYNHGNASRSKNDRRIFNIKATFILDSLVVECWHRGPGFNPQSRTASYQRRYKNGTSSECPCLALNIQKGNTGSFSRSKIRK